MCGRFASAKHDVDLIGEVEADVAIGEPLPLSWNVAPTQDVRVVLERPVDSPDQARAERQLRTLRWGLVPAWAEGPKVGSRMINARVETLDAKPAYRSALSRRRCLVPSTGYFEWERRGDRTVPTFLHADGATLWFAGLYEVWRDRARQFSEDGWLRTFTIVTSPAADELGHIHRRSPVPVPRTLWKQWLDPHLTAAPAALDLLRSIPAPALRVREISNAVNNHRNNGPLLVEPASNPVGGAPTL